MMITKAVIIIVIISLAFITYFSFFEKTVISKVSSPNMTEQEKIIQFINDCERKLKESDEDYVICCREQDTLYLCNNKKKYKEGDFVIVHVNLQKINDLFNPYYACGLFFIDEVEGISEYKTNIKFTISEEEFPPFICTRRLYKTDYEVLSYAGNVKKYKDKDFVRLANILIYLDKDYKNMNEFIDGNNNFMSVLTIDRGLDINE